jgi:hypothetical protein
MTISCNDAMKITSNFLNSCLKSNFYYNNIYILTKMIKIGYSKNEEMYTWYIDTANTHELCLRIHNTFPNKVSS